MTFSFIASILGVYLVLLFTAVRLDRRDAVNGVVIELIDNNDKHAQKYVLEIETGMRRNAGTTAKVSNVGTTAKVSSACSNSGSDPNVVSFNYMIV